MATLTDTAAFARKAVVATIISIIVISILFITVPIVVSKLKKPEPPPVVAPESAFGKLPPIVFPKNKTYPLSFKLENIEGRPPEASTTAKVYFLPQKSANFFSRKNAISFAQKLGFYNEPENVSDIIYKFIEDDKYLTLDITSLNFYFQRNYDSSFFQDSASLEENLARAAAQAFLANLGLFDSLLTKVKTTYLAYDKEKLMPVSKPADAHAARVDFLRPFVENAPIITAGYDESNIYLIFSPKRDNPPFLETLIEASFQNSHPNTSYSSSYSIISGASAWEDLKNGKGYIVKPLTEGSEAIVRKIYQAYFLSFEYQPYLQPVFVFEGDRNFVGIVPAIDPFWIGS